MAQMNMNGNGIVNETFLIKRPQDNLERYIEEREAFFMKINSKCASVGRSPQFEDVKLAARIYNVIPLPNGGYKLEKRKVPLTIDTDSKPGVSAMIAEPSRRMGLDQSIRRGKYSDSMRLIGEDMTGIEMKELQHDGSGNFN